MSGINHLDRQLDNRVLLLFDLDALSKPQDPSCHIFKLHYSRRQLDRTCKQKKSCRRSESLLIAHFYNILSDTERALKA
jgi:hypothetical protein